MTRSAFKWWTTYGWAGGCPLRLWKQLNPSGSWEEGDFEGAQLRELEGASGASRAQVQEAYLAAISWVRDMGGLLR